MRYYSNKNKRVNKNFLEEFSLIILQSINVEITNFLLILTFKCLEEASVGSEDSEECKAKIKNLKRRNSIQLNITIWWVLIKKQLHSKFGKLSGRKHSNNIPIKEEILTNSRFLLMHMMFWLILKKGNFMMSMEKKVSRLEDHQVEEDLTYLICLEESNQVGLERGKLD